MINIRPIGTRIAPQYRFGVGCVGNKTAPAMQNVPVCAPGRRNSMSQWPPRTAVMWVQNSGVRARRSSRPMLS